MRVCSFFFPFSSFVLMQFGLVWMFVFARGVYELGKAREGVCISCWVGGWVGLLLFWGSWAGLGRLFTAATAAAGWYWY
jgi:hypothetical protein